MLKSFFKTSQPCLEKKLNVVTSYASMAKKIPEHQENISL